MSSSRTMVVSGQAPEPADRASAQRIGDADRNVAAELIADATAEGLLHFEEMDERLSRVLTARTAGEVDQVTADLPPEWLRQRRRAARASRDAAESRRGFARHLSSYLLVMTGLVAVWAMVGVTTSAWYPWPVWPALGWGLGIFSHARAAYGGHPAQGRASSPGFVWGCHGRRAHR